jgi:uncharacterized protein (AIM24 family)
MTEYTPMNPLPPGVGLDVMLSPATPGNIILLHLDGQTKWRIEKGAYLACDGGVLIGVETQSIAQGCCSGEVRMLLVAWGSFVIVLRCIRVPSFSDPFFLSYGCVIYHQGFFLLSAEGVGRLVLNAYGSILR